MEPKIFRCTDPKPAGSPALLREELCRDASYDINLVRVDAGVEKPEHPFDAGDSFMLVLSGELRLVVDGQAYDLHPGDLAWIPKGAARGFTAGPGGMTMVAVHLREA
ncbi:MAG: cupin domain-containing protein [Bacillota bacterium]|nr:MAG: hypothetical protein DIU55_01285 [Bacillota bacterium]